MRLLSSHQESDVDELSPEDRLLFEKLAHYFRNQKKSQLTSRELAFSILWHEHESGRYQVTEISRVPSQRP